MNTDFVVYGNKLDLENFRFHTSSQNNWSENCFAMDIFGYCLEEAEIKNDVFNHVVSGNAHVDLKIHYEDVVKNWAKRLSENNPFLKHVGINFTNEQMEDCSFYTEMGILDRCARISYDGSNTHDMICLINAKEFTKFRINLQELHTMFLKREGERANACKTGGGLHEVNPINGNNIIAKGPGYIISTNHCMKQVLKTDTFKQVFANVHLFNSTLLKLPATPWDLIIEHLGVEIITYD